MTQNMKKDNIHGEKRLIMITIIVILFICSFVLIRSYLIAPIPELPEPPTYKVLELSEKVQVIVTDSYPNLNELHFGQMPITYKLEGVCLVNVEKRILLAFETISSETDSIIKFQETNKNPDILIFCKPRNYKEHSTDEGFVSYYELVQGDAYFLVDENNENLINYGEINFYGEGFSCGTGFPLIEVHEILHTFGFNHSYGVRSVMRPETPETSRSCNIGKIDDEIITKLKEIYK